MSKILLLLNLIVIILSCNDNIFIEKKLYPNGSIKEEIKHEGINKKITKYYPNGIVSKIYSRKGDVMDGEFIEYDENGLFLAKGYFKNGSAIGPTYYFSKGEVVLYNERDFNKEIYYVKKFDSVSHKLIKEEGICLSQKPIIKQIKDIQELYFFYAQPAEYINSIRVEIDKQEIKFDTIKGHIGVIQLKLPEAIGKVVKIFSILKFNSVIICQDSIQEFIVPRI